MVTVLGVAWGQKYIALLAETIDSQCAGVGPLSGLDGLCDEACRAVWLHELGRVLGRVDNGVAMVEPHKSEDKGVHGKDKGCLMYWAYEGPAVMDVLKDQLTGSKPPLTLGPKCWADLKAAQAGQ